MNRQEIIKQIVEEQEKAVASLEKTVAEYQSASDLDESEPRDMEDLSHQDEAKDMQLRYETMLAEAQNNLALLKSETEAAPAGSLVDLGDKILFLGASAPKFEIDGKEIISVSPEAPIFSELKDKKKGDKIKLGDDSFTIKDIF